MRNNHPVFALSGAVAPRAFTLVELLVVVSVIAVLAAVALPNFLEAQARAKVVAAQAGAKAVADALEAYAVDNGAYPVTRGVAGDPLALLGDVQLRVLTTPVAYLGPGAFRDPFGTIQLSQQPVRRRSADDFPELQAPNPRRSLLYYHYPSLAARFRIAELDLFGACVLSIGPDVRDSFGAFRPFSAEFMDTFLETGMTSPVDFIYDPTNGTVSSGDIPRFVGAAQRFVIP